MLTIGIDVGVTGALAALDDAGNYAGLCDLPVMYAGKSKWIDAAGLMSMLLDVRDGKPARAIVEHIHATPKMGCKTGHSLGLTVGSVLATLQIASIPFDLVTPVAWKKSLGLLAPGASDREKKLASLCKARMLFPGAPLDRQKDNGRAEALLIAHWAQRYQARAAA